MEDVKQYRYDAFISYRHTELDKMVAEKLHKMLETFKVPSSIAKKTGKKKINRVFRDRDELPTSNNLAASIQEALENSEYLIVICSRETQKSQWVLKEIETFINLHGHEKVLALLIDGEPYESFPEQLRFVHKQIIKEDGSIEETVLEVEPLAADIRAETKNQTIKTLKTELLRLVAPILGCKYDDLKQRHRERFIKKVVTLCICTSLFFLIFGSFSAWQALRINEEHQNTLKSQSMYLSNISSKVLAEGDRKTAMLIALEALPKDIKKPEKPYVEEAEFSLSQALAAYKTNSYFMGDLALNHKKYVDNIQLSPDGKKILTSCQDGYIYVWKTSDGRQIAKFKQGSESDQYFSKDGNNILFLSDNNHKDSLCMKNLYTQKTIWNINDYISHLFISNDGSKIAYYSSHKLIICDSSNGKQLISIQLTNENDLNFYITNVKFSNDNSKIAVTSNQKYVSVFNIKNGKELYRLKQDYQYNSEVTFSPDDKIIATASNYTNPKNPFINGKGTLSIWDSSYGKKRFDVNINTANVHNLKFSPDNPNFLAFSEDSKVSVLDIHSKNIFYSISHNSSINSILMANNGIMYTADYEGSVKLSSLNEKIEFSDYQINHPNGISMMDKKYGIIAVSSRNSNAVNIYKVISAPKIKTLHEGDSALRDACFSNNSNLALCYSYDKSELNIFDITNLKKKGTIKEFAKPVNNAVFVHKDKYITTISDDNYLKLWDSSTLKLIKKCNLRDSDNLNIVNEYNKDGNLAAVGQFEKINIYDTIKCKKIISIKTKRTADTIAFSNDSKKLCFSIDKEIYFVNKNNPNSIKLIKKLDQTINSITFSYDDTQLIVALDDKSINIYNIKSGKLTKTLYQTGISPFPPANVIKCIYNKEGSILITIDEGKVANLWDTSNYKLLATIGGFLNIDCNSKNILASQYKKLFLLPHYDTSSLVNEAKKQLKGRTLTNKEKEDYFISH